jgi:ABC-2 type transport system permease protein
VRESWQIYRALAGAYIRSRLQYPFSFWLGAIVTMLSDLAPLFLIGIVFTRFPTIRGWHWRDIALLYGLAQLSVALMRCFGTQVDRFDEYIVSGDFDSFLIRPLSPIFHLMAARFEITQSLRVLSGAGILLIAGRAAHVPFTLANIALVLAAVLGGAMLMLALTMMAATLSFWHTRTGKLQDFIQGAGREFADYPLTIYPSPVRWLLTLAIPMALITYYPAQLLLGRNETGPLLPLFALAALPMGALFLALAAFLWHLGLKRYQSTGS